MALEPKSWGEAVQQYQANKVQAPPLDVGNYVPRREYRDARFNQKADERRYDIFTHQYRDPVLERTVQKKEFSQITDAMSRAKDRSLRYESHYDVINHEPKLMSSGAPSKPEKPVKRAPRETAPWDKDDRLKRGQKRFEWEHMQKREHNLISNRYIDRNHEEALQAEIAAAQKQEIDKFYKHNDFNAIKGSYYHPDKESSYQDEQLQRARVHGQAQLTRFPRSMTQGDGFTYDILNPKVVYNPNMMEQREARDQAMLKRMGLKHSMESSYKEGRMARETQEWERRHARWAKQPRQEDIRGYHILTNNAKPQRSVSQRGPRSRKPTPLPRPV